MLKLSEREWGTFIDGTKGYDKIVRSDHDFGESYRRRRWWKGGEALGER